MQDVVGLLDVSCASFNRQVWETRICAILTGCRVLCSCPRRTKTSWST